jgi:hypothetical protein
VEIVSTNTRTLTTGNYPFAMNKLKFAFVGIVLAAAAVALVIQHQAQVRLRQENESLRQQLDQLARLQAENEQLSNRLAQANTVGEARAAELLKLRNEVGMLRKQGSGMADVQRQNQQLNAAPAKSSNAQLETIPMAAPKVNAPDNAAATANVPGFAVNLGAIQLVNQTPNRFDLGGGKVCTLTPTIDADGNYSIKLLFAAQKADGSTAISEADVITSPGRAVALEAGGNMIAFTPAVNPGP